MRAASSSTGTTMETVPLPCGCDTAFMTAYAADSDDGLRGPSVARRCVRGAAVPAMASAAAPPALSDAAAARAQFRGLDSRLRDRALRDAANPIRREHVGAASPRGPAGVARAARLGRGRRDISADGLR